MKSAIKCCYLNKIPNRIISKLNTTQNECMLSENYVIIVSVLTLPLPLLTSEMLLMPLVF